MMKSKTVNDVKYNLSTVILPVACRILCKGCWFRFGNIFAHRYNMGRRVAVPEFLPFRRM